MFTGSVEKCFAFAECTLCCSHFPCFLPLGLFTLRQQPFLSLAYDSPASCSLPCPALYHFANNQANKHVSFLPLGSGIGFF